MNKCPDCAGAGVIEKDDKMFECQCSIIKRMAISMPPFIRNAEVKIEHVNLPITKQIARHNFVIASWMDMRSVIKVMMISNQSKFIKVTSDREIRDVFVGSKSRAAKGDEDGNIYNNLEDLVDSPHLIIVRLNELSYKNKAAPGALEEAICYRIDRDKPIWLFSNSLRPFVMGSHAWSDSIQDIIDSQFNKVIIPGILHQQAFTDDIVKQSVQKIRQNEEPILDIEPVEKPEKKTQKIKKSKDSTDFLSQIGSGHEPSKKFRRGLNGTNIQKRSPSRKPARC